jgi:hypothetical protein
MPRSNPTVGSTDLVGTDWPGASDPNAKRIDLHLVDVPLVEALEQIGREVHVNVIPLAELEDKPTRVTLRARQVSWRDAVVFLARYGSHRVVAREGGFVLVEPLPRMTLETTDANLREVLQLLAARAGRNLVLAPEVQGDVTLSFKEIPYADLLETLPRLIGDYEVVHDGADIVRVGARRPDAAVTFANGRRLEVQGWAIVRTPAGEARRVVIANRVYAPGDQLLDAANQPLGVKVLSIEAGVVELEDVVDPAHPRARVNVEGRK